MMLDWSLIIVYINLCNDYESVVPDLQLGNTMNVDAEAQGIEMLAKLNCQSQSDMKQANDSDMN